MRRGFVVPFDPDGPQAAAMRTKQERTIFVPKAEGMWKDLQLLCTTKLGRSM